MSGLGDRSHYVRHEEALVMCPRCRAMLHVRNIEATAYGATSIACESPESDADLRARVAQGGMIGMKDAQFTRQRCTGRYVLVPQHDAALAAFKVGGPDAAVFVITSEPRP